jgi:hypothetical protein
VVQELERQIGVPSCVAGGGTSWRCGRRRAEGVRRFCKESDAR